MTSSVVVISSAACEPAAGGGAGVLLVVRMRELGVRVSGIGAACAWLRHERSGMIVVRRRRILAGQPVAGADERDGAGNDGAQERQEDDGLVHYRYPATAD